MTSFTTKRLGFFTRLLDDVPAGERYRLALAQIEAAEQHGYDTAWIAQHHFDPDEGGLPSPLVFLAHVAARTRTIRLGTGVITLPVEDPLRIAEDTAVLDLLSGGRLEIGLGTGGTPATFTAFGLAPEERGQVHAVKLAKLRNAWNGQEITDGRRLYPASPQLNNRVWQATFSVEGGRRAGLAGDGLMLSRTQPRPKDRPFLALDDIQNPIIDAYLEALPDGVEPRILASRSIFIADSRKEALRHAETGLRRVAKRFEASGHTLRGNSLEDLLATFDTHTGTPDEVSESLSRDTSLERATDVSMQVHSIDPPHELILRSIELLAEITAPALGWRSPVFAQERIFSGLRPF